MKNKHVGIIIVILSFLIGFIIFTFNQALIDLVGASCSHEIECPMWGTIRFQTDVSLGIMAAIILAGIYLIFFGKEKSKKINYHHLLNEVKGNEKKLFEIIINNDGTIFQSELVEKTKLNKVKVSRLLDKLEGKNLIERRRRGMTNVIILKHKNN